MHHKALKTRDNERCCQIMMLMVKVIRSSCWLSARVQRGSTFLGILRDKLGTLKGYSAGRVVSVCADTGWHQEDLSLKL